jgi:molybdopterin/thiamine biosynthesis adenylyltransferase/rhodanese-related sulfurtransferase
LKQLEKFRIGGFIGWAEDKDASAFTPTMNQDPSTAASAFRPEELSRYARHFSLPEVGLEGQRKLKAGSVLCIGAGGLGSPATMYLAAAGVGRIGIVDPDVVDATNLQRQILHGERDIGRSKLQSALATLEEINPHVAIEQYETRFTSANALQIAAPYDVILDGTDNFATRYLSNDVSFFLKKPNVYGSILRFEGQCSVFAPHLGGPCYRCLFPEPPDPGAVPSCAEGGVLGVLPGVIGSMQALEAIKLLLGVGEPLVGRLVHFDALKFKFREFKLKRDEQCPLCGVNPEIEELMDYDQFCGGSSTGSEETAVDDEVVPVVTVRELAARREKGDAIVVLDVREPFEVGICHLEGAVTIPLGELETRYAELDPGKETLVLCKSGYRSETATAFLRRNGFSRAANIEGGIDAWAENIDLSMPRY